MGVVSSYFMPDYDIGRPALVDPGKPFIIDFIFPVFGEKDTVKSFFLIFIMHTPESKLLKMPEESLHRLPFFLKAIIMDAEIFLLYRIVACHPNCVVLRHLLPMPLLAPAVVRRNEDKPFFIKLLLPLLYRHPAMSQR